MPVTVKRSSQLLAHRNKSTVRARDQPVHQIDRETRSRFTVKFSTNRICSRTRRALFCQIQYAVSPAIFCDNRRKKILDFEFNCAIFLEKNAHWREPLSWVYFKSDSL